MFKLFAPRSSTEGNIRLMSCDTLEADYFQLKDVPYQQPLAEPLGNLIPDVFDFSTLFCIRSSSLLLQVGISIPRYQSSGLNKGRICTCKGM